MWSVFLWENTDSFGWVHFEELMCRIVGIPAKLPILSNINSLGNDEKINAAEIYKILCNF